jgi:quercetin dioxygenase-like cupin family protein
MNIGDQLIRKSSGERYVLTSTGLGENSGYFGLDYYLSPHASGPPLHSHDDEDETIEVISGSLLFLIDGKEELLSSGSTITIAAGTVHGFRNKTDEEVFCRIKFSNSGFEKLLSGLYVVKHMPFSALGFLQLAVLSLEEISTSRPSNWLLQISIRVFGGVAKRLGVRSSSLFRT